MRHVVVPGMLVIYKFKEHIFNITDKITYILTPNGRTMRSGFYSHAPLTTHHGLSFSMTYDTYEAHLLPPPFETKCFDYRQKGLPSRGDCYEACIRSEMLDINGLVPHGVNIFEDESRNILGLLDFCFNSTMKAVMRKVDKICDTKCNEKDCHSINHIPRQLTYTKTPRHSYIMNVAPQSPTVRASCQRMLTLPQYFTDLFSTFGFWLGISAFGFFRFVRRSTEAITEAYKPVLLKPIVKKAAIERLRTPEGFKRYGAEYGVVQKSVQKHTTGKSLPAITPATVCFPSRAPVNQQRSLEMFRKPAYDYLLSNRLTAQCHHAVTLSKRNCKFDDLTSL
jgi:hypothetical protein